MNEKINLDSVSELQKRVQDFCEARDWDQFHSPKELAIGLSTEANELLQLFRFKTDEQMTEMMADPKKRDDVEQELADSFNFILRFAQMNNINLGQALMSKLAKNDAKYPVETSRGSNRKYNE